MGIVQASETMTTESSFLDQLLASAVGGLLGGAFALLGVRFALKGQTKQWGREARYPIYMAFYRASLAYIEAAVQTDLLRGQINENSPEEERRAWEDSITKQNTAWATMQRTSAEMDFFGTPDVSKAAEHLIDGYQEMMMGMREDPQAAYFDMREELDRRRKEFLDKAKEDLGLE